MKSKNIEVQERVLLRIQKELELFKKTEAEVRRLWTLGHKKYMSATKALNARRKKGLTTDPIKNGLVNKTVQSLWETMEGWEDKSDKLTQQRDDARLAMDNKKNEILQEEELLQELLYQETIQLQKTDEMLDTVFMLNNGVVSALEYMDRVLSSEVFPLLHEKGTQKLIENSSSTKKIVIMTNTINSMDVAKVEEAFALINEFFDRINPKKEVEEQDDMVAMLSSLIKELLVIKAKTKFGPSLSRFLSLDFSQEKFPELCKAQKLLATATNYSRSGLYVKLFVREDKDSSWVPVRQS